ncbi:hypothetical protein LCGC14_0402080 [marine sediment metagenome]|uniref:Quinate/shikimate 5-dehydrogenase/glutamyl-tRNA reductase domain-containing protein n=1 Tax=marine sediment metagenome TaxID=412755 RepID=A0A0F9TEQ8_9ZZZZ
MYPYNPSRTYLLAQCGLSKTFVRGEGHILTDADGQRYLDFLSQYGVVSFGHNHPQLVAALQAVTDAARPAMVQPFVGQATEELAEKLRDVTPGELGCTVFTNSGAEAVEAAIKLARARTGRLGILSTIGGFHGKTLGALSATGNPVYQTRFGAPVPGFEYVPYGDLNALADKLQRDGDAIAAFIVEPVQGEGGMVPAPPGYLAGAIELCRAAGAVAIFDEVQTGLGRTGAMFACQHAGAAPDILLLGKALGGGLMPIGACIATTDTWDHSFGMLHSSTFAGNELACAVGSRVIDLLLADEGKLVEHVDRMGRYLLERLGELKDRFPHVLKAVRGKGLMAGVEFQRFEGDGSFSMGFASRSGLLTVLLSGYLLNLRHIVTAAVFNNAHFLRLEPPFTVGRDEIDQAVNAVESICRHVDAKDYHELFRHLTDVPGVPRPQGLYLSAATEMREQQTPPPTDGNGTFAFLIHYIDQADYVRVDPSFGKFSSDRLGRWRDWVAQIGPGVLNHVPQVRSKNGAETEGWMLAVPMLPRQLLEISHSDMLGLFRRAIDVAKRRGAKILGLGGFNSVITRGGQRIVGQGIAITTGNSLSGVMAVDGIRQAVRDRGGDLGDLHLVVVGATGAIGRLCSLLLAPLVGRLTLVGNSLQPDAPRRCRVVAGDVYRGALQQISNGDGAAAGPVQQAVVGAIEAALKREGGTSGGLQQWISQHMPPDRPDETLKLAQTLEDMFDAASLPLLVRHTCDLAGSVADADVVLLATSSDRALIGPEDLQRDAIVCDVARPSNVAADLPSQRPDVLVFEGGLVDVPELADIGRDFQVLPPGTTLGCLAETVLLALEGDYTDHSIGQRLDLAEAQYIGALAEKHGFAVASPETCRKR